MVICISVGFEICFFKRFKPWFCLQLIDGYETDNTVRPLVDNHDWYIMPMINPDGYEYTWTTVSVS